jgi:hypothetical protein
MEPPARPSSQPAKELLIMTKLNDTTEHPAKEGPGKNIPAITDEISLALTHADELLKCALDGIEVTTACDIAREKLRQIENLLMMAQEKISDVRRSNLNIFKTAAREKAA